MKNLNLFQGLAAVLCLSLTACSHSDGGSGGDSSDTSVTKQYHVVDDGCDSGIHTFSGSSQEDVTAKYCAALEDEDLNRDHTPQKAQVSGSFCSDDSRRALFQANCQGQFISKFPTTNASNPTSSQPSSSGAPSSPGTPSTVEPKPSVIPGLIANAKSLDDIAKILNLENPASSNQYDEATLKAIAEALKAKMNIIASSASVGKQQELMSYAEYRLSPYSDFLNVLSLEFMKSSNELLRTDAAGMQLSIHPENVRAIEIVRDGTSSRDADVRYESISSLSNYPRITANDRITILNAIADSDQNVRNVSQSAAEQMKLNEEYIPTLSNLLTNSNADVRYSGAAVLAQIPGSRSSQVLISHLTDSDQNVRNILSSSLESRSLTTSELPALAHVLENGGADSRYSAAALVNSISGDGASQLLIAHLGDRDQNVRNIVSSSLESRSLSTLDLNGLAAQLGSSNPDVRYTACALVSSISGTKATELLVDRLSDSDQNVRNIASSSLESRTLSDSDLSPLVTQLNSSSADARYTAASLIGGIHSAAGKAALRRRQAVETDQNVKNIIESALNWSP